MGGATNVVVVDDHELLAEALCIALRATGVGATRVDPAVPDVLVAAVIAQAPDLVLLDLDLGGFGDSTPVVAALDAAGLRVLVVTGVTDRIRIARALEAGALAYRSKSVGFDALVAAVTTVAAAAEPVDAAERVQLLAELRRHRLERERQLAPFDLLTDREKATLRAVADGRNVGDIATDWVVSEATVRTHVRGVLGKLDVRSQLAAVAVALRSGWLTDSAERTDRVRG